MRLLTPIRLMPYSRSLAGIQTRNFSSKQASIFSKRGKDEALVECAGDKNVPDRMKLCWSLLKEGADPNGEDRFGILPLHAAISAKYYGVANLLLERGANPYRRVLDKNAFDIAGTDRVALEILQFYKKTH